MTKKNESPILTGRQATAQGVVAEQQPIEINGAILTPQAIETLRSMQGEYRLGLSMIEDLRKTSRFIINVGNGIFPNDNDMGELFSLLSGLDANETFIERLLPYGYTLEKEEVCHD